MSVILAHNVTNFYTHTYVVLASCIIQIQGFIGYLCLRIYFFHVLLLHFKWKQYQFHWFQLAPWVSERIWLPWLQLLSHRFCKFDINYPINFLPILISSLMACPLWSYCVYIAILLSGGLIWLGIGSLLSRCAKRNQLKHVVFLPGHAWLLQVA